LLVQRLFFMFPSGLPGLALVLLRASIVSALLLDTYAHRPELSGWMPRAAILLSLLISVGFLTPIVALVTLLLHGLIWFTVDVGNPVVAAIVGLDAAALALLGPGAYSVDSHRFGRRVIEMSQP
jgi:hypothetical protein